jgi:hypothetical protein
VAHSGIGGAPQRDALLATQEEETSCTGTCGVFDTIEACCV